jgi:hypothetical protein
MAVCGSSVSTRSGAPPYGAIVGSRDCERWLGAIGPGEGSFHQGNAPPLVSHAMAKDRIAMVSHQNKVFHDSRTDRGAKRAIKPAAAMAATITPPAQR